MDALLQLRHVADDYAARPIADAFNWQEASAELGDGQWYLVAFRSVRKETADEARLEAYDERAHQEAAAAPGFVHYYKGPKASDGSCLSFCLWTSRTEARTASGGPAHIEAVGLIAEMYERYTLEFHRVGREAGGPLTFAPYDSPPMPVNETPPDMPDAARPTLALRPAPAS